MYKVKNKTRIDYGQLLLMEMVTNTLQNTRLLKSDIVVLHWFSFGTIHSLIYNTQFYFGTISATSSEQITCLTHNSVIFGP